MRENDLAARIGGEEFALISPETTLAGGHALAEKLRRALESEPIRHDGAPIAVTVSIGVAQFTVALEQPDALHKLADARLYEAKRSGRNQVR